MRPRPAVVAHHFAALGTSCSLFGLGVSQTQLLNGEVWVRELGARITRFSDRSELAALNQSDGAWVDVSPETEELLRESLRAYELSAGLVNVAVLPSMLAIGYTRPLAEGTSSATPQRAAPAPALADVLRVRPRRARLQPGCGLDLGGIAKGWMADRLALKLGPDSLANIGGDLRAVGPRPAGGGWPGGVGGGPLKLRVQGATTISVGGRTRGELRPPTGPRP